MLGLGIWEVALLGVLLIVVVGPERLPHLIRGAGRMYGQVRRASDELRRAFVLEADRADADERYKALEKRRNDALEARRRAAESNPDAVPQPSVLSEPPPQVIPDSAASEPRPVSDDDGEADTDTDATAGNPLEQA